jgi:hypothetical protein
MDASQVVDHLSALAQFLDHAALLGKRVSLQL